MINGINSSVLKLFCLSDTVSEQLLVLLKASYQAHSPSHIHTCLHTNTHRNAPAEIWAPQPVATRGVQPPWRAAWDACIYSRILCVATRSSGPGKWGAASPTVELNSVGSLTDVSSLFNIYHKTLIYFSQCGTAGEFTCSSNDDCERQSKTKEAFTSLWVSTDLISYINLTIHQVTQRPPHISSHSTGRIPEAVRTITITEGV